MSCLDNLIFQVSNVISTPIVSKVHNSYLRFILFCCISFLVKYKSITGVYPTVKAQLKYNQSQFKLQSKAINIGPHRKRGNQVPDPAILQSFPPLKPHLIPKTYNITITITTTTKYHTHNGTRRCPSHPKGLRATRSALTSLPHSHPRTPN